MTWTLSAFADEAGHSTDEQIAALRNAGLSRIDIRKIDGHNIAALPLDAAHAIKTRLDKAGIEVAMFGSPVGKIDVTDEFQGELDKLRHMADLADVLDCRAVRIFSYFNRTGLPFDRFADLALDRLRQLRDLAGQLRMTLWHENEKHIFGERCPAVERLARELGDERTFRLIYDFDNYHQAGDDNGDNWQRLKDATDAFHLKDSDAKHQHVPVGHGAGKVREILSDALQRGWSGPLSLEPHLSHSGAVADTGPHGQANAAYADKAPAECFQIAAAAAHKLLKEIGARAS